MVKPRSSKNRTAEFTQSEVDQMEKVLRDNEGLPFDENHYQSLAEKLNLDSRRAGKDVLHWKKVQSWFEDKQQHKKADGTAPTYVIDVDSDSSPESFSPKNDPAVLVGEDLPGLDELEFEARSGKDGAWYDVAAFIAHRVLESGEPEVRVRFVGFGAAEDEWVNVKRAVRQRSLPLESSECFRVNPGAHVLCFRERKDQAVYFDAHVVEVEKKRHDVRGCRCRFLVHYMHDQSEDIVSLRRLCLRPPK